ncbi:NAD(P)-dependent iron-only hydrogenase iron-sulfur protein [Natranaerovirga hydrolytica]|uniref:NAD(P)-dependent iron-only hydrogenase iron-sulfur protein n=1 Tax=Natranaerovirga hydrolytica TaxID=680378 RepID=A0A4R1MAH9_9FIRM|nr:(2Fe-2S) ferredoxin domain-containing protein [Natranaerovirga hydrolytica]TCK87954.1 NAD(P)-dependent iron-only hydrogenase iron-sulfur protein [Natranaerovirga hydrolytica]
MAKIKSLEELTKLKEEVRSTMNVREQGDNIEKLIRVKVAMATCGIASGAREIMDYFITTLGSEGMDNVVVTQSGCMGYCYAEPTIEVTLPEKEPVVYGNVTKEKVDEIISQHIKKGELVDGIIPITHQTIE